MSAFGRVRRINLQHRVIFPPSLAAAGAITALPPISFETQLWLHSRNRATGSKFDTRNPPEGNTKRYLLF
jgi:hypothetical protein